MGCVSKKELFVLRNYSNARLIEEALMTGAGGRMCSVARCNVISRSSR